MQNLDRTKILKIQSGESKEGTPKIVALGGGTGLSTLLRGLKKYDVNITAVVTVADNGGSSGMLREDLNILPPGDIRNCILALAQTEPLMFNLMNFRFSSDKGRLSGQNFGNLFIAAMSEVSGSFYDAVRNMSKVLAVKGKVLPVSLDNINISAIMSDGDIIEGECTIGDRTDYKEKSIERIFMKPSNAKPLMESCEEISDADILILGPGSLYTSILPNLLFPEIRKSVINSKAIKIYIANLMTQPAETYNYTVEKHLEAIKYVFSEGDKDTAYTKIIDYCVVNNQLPDPSIMEKYLLGDARLVDYSNESFESKGIKIIEAPLVKINRNGAIRHNKDLLAELILHIWTNHN